MSKQSAAVSSSPVEDRKIVARVRVVNGNVAVHTVFTTRKGLFSCLEKYVGDEFDPRKHCPRPSLQELASMVMAAEILLTTDPNVEKPVLDRCISAQEFFASGEDFQSMGGIRVRHQPARPFRTAVT